jgi:multiple sugar transport system permease protein
MTSNSLTPAPYLRDRPIIGRNGVNVEKIAIYLVLLLVVFTTIVPFYWMVTTSLKTDETIFKMPPDFLPSPATGANYQQVFELMPMGNALLNSVKISVIATFGTLASCSLAAYAFAKIRFRFRNVLFFGFLATMMIPGQVTLIPLYILFSRMGWIDTHLPLTIPFMLLNAYGVFLLRQFMASIPDAYIEAARLDGATHLQIYLRIVLPLCKPALVTLGLFSFLGNWNNFLGPLIFLNTESNFTIPLIINSFRTAYGTQWGLLMAAACVAIIPPLVLYLLAQRFFIQGVALSGLKG